MKKLLLWLLALVAFACFTCCGASNGGAKTVATVAKEENTVAITVEELEGACTLLELMKDLQEDGKFSFTADLTGMIQSIDGKANDAAANAYWMLYTSDGEMSNTEWGTVEYGGATYGSAVVGASALEVIAGGLYIWSYQSFTA